MIGLPALYTFAGLLFAAYAWLSATRHRFGNAAFWALLAASFLGGDRFGDFGNGLLVLALVALAGTGALKKPDVGDAAEDGARRGNWLFLPALMIPATALAGTFLLPNSGLFDPKQVTLISLGLGVLIALVILYAWLRPPALSALEEGRRLIDAVGWAAVLPQMLAALGAVFAVAGIGDLVGGMAISVIPHGSLFAAVFAYAIGMVLFTMIMGNAFAAFPVMTAAIGLPLLVHGFGGDPAIVCAIGMLAGFCGTLMTPMAANFNIVPAALLELEDRNAVVKAQVGTAIPLLACNILLIYWLAFP
ncbi:DUF979 domain-containing protein [Sphingomonas sp.]|uniref:DUF979 domain-containing protein n=1 Tax=Sphingomonas sp. TaxID=28214 RepID=UPI002DBCFC1C|nr:DUF979 domain-containing protein [Sphingomonas sp.]HEU4969958.1 DUF979 domain-containing protein [Sphingomonas sp.]